MILRWTLELQRDTLTDQYNRGPRSTPASEKDGKYMLERASVASALGKQDVGVSETAPSAQALAPNHDDMSSVPWPHVVDGKNKLQQPVH